MINCGADCDELFALTAPITITATAAPGSVFVGWQGNCSGVAPTCNLSISDDRGHVDMICRTQAEGFRMRKPGEVLQQ